MQLYGSSLSPFVRHCRIALMQENLDFEFIEATAEMIVENSPTRKVPFLLDNGLVLTDSSTILKYIREKAGSGFLTDIEDYELFAMTNTLIDATLNLFILEKDGITPETSNYLAKQKSRIKSGLTELNNRIDLSSGIDKDSHLRCACYVDWAVFRNRITLEKHANLQTLLNNSNDIEVFSSTGPTQ